MDITPEQSDEVFIVLASCGLNGKVSNVNSFGTDDSIYYRVYSPDANYEVYLKDGAVERVKHGDDILYPESEAQAQADERAAEEESKKEEAKNTAILIDNQAFQLVLNSEKIVSLLQEGITIYSNGEASALDLYDLAKTAEESQSTLSYSASSLRDDNNGDYIDACTLYIINGRDFAKKIMKFLDTSEMTYLSEAKECITNSESYVSSVVAARSLYLSDQGLSDGEISDIMNTSTESAS